MALHDFNPNFKSKHVEPSFGGKDVHEFPFDEIDKRIFGKEETELADSTSLDALQLIRLFLEFIADVKAKDNRALSPVATRALACVWVMKPELVGNCAGHMVAKSYGISYQKFSEHAAEFSRRFGIRNRYQDHDAKNKGT